jgi:hypothetical protein
MTFPLADHDWPDHHDIKTQSPNTIPLIFLTLPQSYAIISIRPNNSSKKMRTAETIRT